MKFPLFHAARCVVAALVMASSTGWAQLEERAARAPIQVLEVEMDTEFVTGLDPGAAKFTDRGVLVVTYDLTNKNRLKVEGKPAIRRSMDDSGKVVGIGKEVIRYVITPDSATYMTSTPPASDYVFVTDVPDQVWANDLAILLGLPLHPDTFQGFKELQNANPVRRFLGLFDVTKLKKGETIVRNPSHHEDNLKLDFEPGRGVVGISESSPGGSKESYSMAPSSQGVQMPGGLPWPSGFTYEFVSRNNYIKSISTVKSAKIRSEQPEDFSPVLKEGTTVKDLRLGFAYTVRKDPSEMIKDLLRSRAANAPIEAK